MATISQRNEGDVQITTLTVETEDAVGETHRHHFEGEHGEPLEYQGEGSPSEAMIEAVEAVTGYTWYSEKDRVVEVGEE